MRWTQRDCRRLVEADLRTYCISLVPEGYLFLPSEVIGELADIL